MNESAVSKQALNTFERLRTSTINIFLLITFLYFYQHSVKFKGLDNDRSFPSRFTTLNWNAVVYSFKHIPKQFLRIPYLCSSHWLRARDIGIGGILIENVEICWFYWRKLGENRRYLGFAFWQNWFDFHQWHSVFTDVCSFLGHFTPLCWTKKNKRHQDQKNFFLKKLFLHCFFLAFIIG